MGTWRRRRQRRARSPDISTPREIYGPAYDWHVRAGSWAQFRDVKATRASWQRARDVADRLPAEEPNKIAMQIGPAPRSAPARSESAEVSRTLVTTNCANSAIPQAATLLPLAMGMAGTMTVLVFHNRFREAAELASECGHLAESFDDQILTVTLSLAAGNAKFQAGQVVEGLRLAQRGIELADRDHTNNDFMIGSPLGFAFGLRGVCRFALGVNGWRDDLDQLRDVPDDASGRYKASHRNHPVQRRLHSAQRRLATRCPCACGDGRRVGRRRAGRR